MSTLQPLPGHPTTAAGAHTGGQPPAARKPSNTKANSPRIAAPSALAASGNGDPESPSYQPAAAPADRQVGAPRSALGEVFYLARSAADAYAELAAAEMEYQQFKLLRDKGAVPKLEFQKAELQLDKSKREVKLIDMQMKALTESMERARELAGSTLEQASTKLTAIEAGYRNGINTDQELTDAKFAVKQAKIALVDADEIVEKLKETMATVQGFDKASNSDQPAEDSSTDTSTASNGTTDQPIEQAAEEEL